VADAIALTAAPSVIGSTTGAHGRSHGRAASITDMHSSIERRSLTCLK
jgi:hypothetical protein